MMMKGGVSSQLMTIVDRCTLEIKHWARRRRKKKVELKSIKLHAHRTIGDLHSTRYRSILFFLLF